MKTDFGHKRLNMTVVLPSHKAVFLGKKDEQEIIDVVLHLRRRIGHEPIPDFSSYIGCLPRKRLSNHEFAQKYGASEEDITAVKTFYQSLGITVTEEYADRRHVHLRGTVKQFNEVFAIEIKQYEKTHGIQKISFHSHEIPPQVPLHLDPIILNIKIENEPKLLPSVTTPPNTQPLTVSQFNGVYDIPTNSASGQTIAIGLFPGWGTYLTSDIQTACSNAGVPNPTIVNVNIDNISLGSSAETTLDITMCAIFGSGAKIALYQANDPISVVSRVAHPASGDPVCSILTISGGSSELNYDISYESTMQDAAIQGITVLAASGDWGATDGSGNVIAVYPASSPYCTAVGGTLVGGTSAGIAAKNSFTEWYWNAGKYYQVGGGGVSVVHAQPSYQSNIGVPSTISSGGTLNGAAGRGTPDISGNAAVESGVTITYNGSQTIAGGTSAASPMYAGIFARINASLNKSIGFINPTLYTIKNTNSIIRNVASGGPTTSSFTDTSNNVTYPGYSVTTTGWNACVGWGSLDTQAFLNYLTNNATTSTIVEIDISANSFPSSDAVGTTVATITVKTTGATFNGSIKNTLSLGGTSQLQVNNNNLVIANAQFSPGTYYIQLQATMSAADNSPFLAPQTAITVTSSGGTQGGQPVTDTTQYAVSYSTASTGPWTVAQGSPFTSLSDTVSGLTSGTSYYFQITASDPVLGVTGSPVVVGPYKTTATSSESAQGTTVTDQSSSITDASQSVWTLVTQTTVKPSPVSNIAETSATSNSLAISWTAAPPAASSSHPGQVTNTSEVSSTSSSITIGWSAAVPITDSTQLQVAENGATDTTTSGVLILVYWNHVVYYEDGSGTWRSWNGSGWAVASGDPRTSTALSPTKIISPSNTIIDSSSNSWGLYPSDNNGLVVTLNGVADTTTKFVSQIKYLGGQIYQRSAGNWWYWTGTSWLPTSSLTTAVSPNTAISDVFDAITDSFLNTWTLVRILGKFVIYLNGVLSPIPTANATLLIYQNGVVYYYDAVGNNWYSWDGNRWILASGDPRSTPINLSSIDKSSGMLLTGNTVTSTQTFSQSIRSQVGYSTGLYYFEVTASQLTSTFAIGISTANYAMNSALGVAFSVGFYPASQAILTGNPSFAMTGTGKDVSGAIISCAVNLTNKLIWFSSPFMRSQGFPWNNVPGADPGAGIGGIAFSIGSGPYYVTFNDSSGGAVASVNFGATLFDQTVPNNFLSWSSAGNSVLNYPTFVENFG